MASSHARAHDVGERLERAVRRVVAGLGADVVLEPARDDQHLARALPRRQPPARSHDHAPHGRRSALPPVAPLRRRLRLAAPCARRPTPRGGSRSAGAPPSTRPCRRRARCARGCTSRRCTPSTTAPVAIGFLQALQRRHGIGSVMRTPRSGDGSGACGYAACAPASQRGRALGDVAAVRARRAQVVRGRAGLARAAGSSRRSAPSGSRPRGSRRGGCASGRAACRARRGRRAARSA